MIGAAIVVPAAIAVGVFVPRDHTSQVELDEVVERFRASTVPVTIPDSSVPVDSATTISPSTPPAGTADTTSTQAPPTAPPATSVPERSVADLVEPGVYLYRTAGSESIDAMSGVAHDYPTETPITVTAEGCGVKLRWDALQERREEWRLCATPAGIELQRESLQYHEFFEQETPEVVLCDRSVTVVPLSDESVDPLPLTCTIEDRPWLPVWEVLEADTRQIEGEPVEVRHVRMTIANDEHYFEHYVADWMLAPSGLPIELTVTKQSKSDSIVGDVVYNEQLQLELISLDPLR
jgi:hypothetical protein